MLRLAETYVEFFFTKKKIEHEKIFQTCTMNIGGIFFHNIFFCCKKKSRVCSSDIHGILPCTGFGGTEPPPTKMSTPSIPGYLNDGNGTGNGTVYLQNHNTWSVMVRLNKRGNVHRNSDGKCIEFFLSPLLSDLFFLR